MDMQNSHYGSDYFVSNYKLLAFDTSDKTSPFSPQASTDNINVNKLMTLFMNNRSTRTLSNKMAQYNAAAVLGALAYKAQACWQDSIALHNITPISNHDLTQASPLPRFIGEHDNYDEEFLVPILMKTMIAASKADGHFEVGEQTHLLKAAEQIGFNDNERNVIYTLMNGHISLQDIVRSVSLSKHKSQVYLSAYFSVAGNNLSGQKFLEDLASAMQFPYGLTAYLEKQADLGIVNS